MAKTTRTQQAIEFYSDDVRALPDRALRMIVRGEGIDKGAGKAVRDALQWLAADELIQRGHLLPHLYALSADL